MSKFKSFAKSIVSSKEEEFKAALVKGATGLAGRGLRFGATYMINSVFDNNTIECDLDEPDNNIINLILTLSRRARDNNAKIIGPVRYYTYGTNLAPIPLNALLIFRDNGHTFYLFNSVEKSEERFGSPFLTTYFATLNRDKGASQQYIADIASPRTIPTDATAENKYIDYYVPQKGRSGDWHADARIPRKELENVIISEATRRDLLFRIDKWISKKPAYLEKGIPHKLIIILYGPPGMGKTTLIRAIASYYNRSLYDCTLNGKSKEELKRLMENAGKNSLVVFEEFDQNDALLQDKKHENSMLDLRSSMGRKSRSDDDMPETDKPVSIEDLLTLFDGLVPLSDRLIIMTTNNLDKIDKRLLRKGRIDAQIKLDLFEDSEVRQYVEKFSPNAQIPEGVEFERISGAELQDLWIMNDDNPAEFVASIPKKKTEAKAA